jgi:hypothetical protein
MGPYHTFIKEIMYLNELLPYQRTGSGGTTVAPGVIRSRTVVVSSWDTSYVEDNVYVSTLLPALEKLKTWITGTCSRSLDKRSRVLVWCCWKHWWRSQPDVCSANCTQSAAGWPNLLPPSEPQLFCILYRSSYLPPSYSGLYLLLFL